jgi:hypothetical protein
MCLFWKIGRIGFLWGIGGMFVKCLTIFKHRQILNHSLLTISHHAHRRSFVVPKSVLEAIKMGIWDYEPPEIEFSRFEASNAMPGTNEKLTILAERAQRGLPLWHLKDRNDVEAPPPASVRRKPR